MKKLTITQHENTIDLLVEGEPMRTWEIAGMIYQAELMCRLKMIDQAAQKSSFRPATDPSFGPAPAETPDTDVEPIEQPRFAVELAALLNRFSKENESNTPDFVLANHLIAALDNFNKTTKSRRDWIGEASTAAADPPIGPAPAAADYPPSRCNCGRCNTMRTRHKRPIEPDTTGEAETAVKGTAKLKTKSNGENDQKS